MCLSLCCFSLTVSHIHSFSFCNLVLYCTFPPLDFPSTFVTPPTSLLPPVHHLFVVHVSPLTTHSLTHSHYSSIIHPLVSFCTFPAIPHFNPPLHPPQPLPLPPPSLPPSLLDTSSSLSPFPFLFLLVPPSFPHLVYTAHTVPFSCHRETVTPEMASDHRGNEKEREMRFITLFIH